MNKNISMKKATSNDVKTYKELLCRLNSLGESLEKHEEWNELRAEFEEPVIAEKEGHVGFLSAEDGRFISEQDYETYSGSLIGCFV